MPIRAGRFQVAVNHRLRRTHQSHERGSIMNGDAFDSMTRQLATRLSRRHLLGLAGLGAVAALPLGFGQGKALAAPGDASALVIQFYENVNAYQYADAYALLGSKWHSQQSLSNFTNGYSNTA